MTFTGRFAAALDEMTHEERDAVLAHLEGGSSANWLSQVLNLHGYSISPTTLKEQRARMRNIDA